MRLRPLPPQAVPVTVAYGDGVGPEVLEATLRVLREADAMLSIEAIEIGQRIYDMESPSAILPSAWEKLHRTKVLLQGPVVSPEGLQHIHTEIYHRMNICEGERHTVSEDCAADTHLGEDFALFSPAHGTLDELKDKNEVSPASMLLAAILMLSHIGQVETAGRIWRAMLTVLQQNRKLSTDEFAEEVTSHLWENYSTSAT